MIVGLTGGIGSGKSEVTRRFQMLGITVVDADQVAREVVQPKSAALQTITSHFGSHILTEHGALDRAQLRQIVFTKPQEKIWLENLLHPIIREKTIQQLQQAQGDYVILVSPLLLESTQYQLVDRILVVDARETLQLSRASLRDSNSIDQINAIMATQLSRSERCKKANDIIYNNGNFAELDDQIKKLHTYYLTLAQEITKHD